ncbi:putative DNA primase/helicase [Streptomyces sp. V3I8]|uniref:DNA primase family protein n=1 Tax=Streptomyces sp. V3I8 TaxID=3042279 RepID=UPI00278B4776|nr:DNA primase family protein [Streptomyces sp. V3I8]MDQ1039674.1 putative DNA primase/helicase [Streptomyces sp. V3I8]
MSDHPASLLKSIPTPTGSGPAEPTDPVSGRSAPKVVAEGVRTALRPDPNAATGSTTGPHAFEDEELPAPSNPLAVARRLLPDWQTEDGQLVCRRWRASWMRWTGASWRELDEAQLRASMYRRLEHAVFYVPGKDEQPEPREWAPTKQKISNLLDAMGAITLLPTGTDAPVWLDTNGDPSEQDCGPIVACANGLLRIRDRVLLPHGPHFFNLVSVPFAYDPTATAPTWERFLGQIWPDDLDAINALQEWFGYVLSGRTDQQKVMLIVGPSRSGKGTIARVLKELVGKENLAGPTLAGLGTNFGLSTLIGKPLAVISDARLSGSDNSQVVERLLTISGEDTIDVDRKYREQWTGKLPTRLMLLSNELPHFGDSSGVIAKRFILLNMRVSWLGKEDTTLTDRLATEMPGILNWALDGIARLQQTGRITEPQSSREAVTTMQDTASPTSAFVRERCATGPTCSVPVDALWNVWREWSEDNGVRPGTKQMFGRNLLSVVPQLNRTRPRDAYGRQVITYNGITLALREPHLPESRLSDAQDPSECR